MRDEIFYPKATQQNKLSNLGLLAPTVPCINKVNIDFFTKSENTKEGVVMSLGKHVLNPY